MPERSLNIYNRILLFALVLLALVIVVAGLAIHRFQLAEYGRRVELDLASLSNFKALQVERWFSERMGDAEVLSDHVFLTQALMDWGEAVGALGGEGEDVARERQIREVLRQYIEHYDYHAVVLVDAEGEVQMELGEGIGDLSGEVLEGVERAIASGEIVRIDLHRARHGPGVHFTTVSPMRVSGGGAGGVSHAVLLVSDAGQFLFRFLDMLPTPSRTKESLLVSREGNEVVYLSNLRFGGHGALEHRLPMSRDELPAVRAIRGEQGVLRGLDYRGEPVVAYVQPVSGTDWFLVTKIDESEAFGEVWRRLASLMAVLGAVLFLGAAGILALWQRGQKIFYREQYRAAEERNRAIADKARMLAVLDQSRESIVITDKEAVIEYVNPAFERATGYSKEEALGLNPRILKSGRHSREYYESMWRTLSSGEKWEGRMVNRRKDGTLYHEQATILPITDADGAIVNYVGIKSDVNAQTAMNEQLRQAQKMDSIGQLAGGVAHDFNNILQAIQGFGELLADDAESGSEVEEFSNEILKCTARASMLTRQLLAFSRQHETAMQRVDLNQVLTALQKMLHRMLGERFELKTRLSETLGPIRADPAQVEQVIMNLVVNARDAMPDGGMIEVETFPFFIDAEFSSEYPWAVEGRYVAITVRDHGEGMDKLTLSRIYEPFFTTKEQGKGTGLGLATVYGIVHNHDGLIDVESEPGEGTTFTVYFPVDTERPRVESAPSESAPEGGSERILVAEDDGTIRRILARLLERNGYEVLSARDGEEAIRIIESGGEAIDLLLVDVVMPRANGREVYQAYRDRRPDGHTLFMSGYSNKYIDSDFMNKERLRLVSKPFSPNAILKAIREVMGGVKGEG